MSTAETGFSANGHSSDGLSPGSLSPDAIERVVRMALLEDAPWGDITSQA